MNYLSVCSGIEAATVAWHPLGWKPVAFSEIERFPSEVLKHHYPNVPNVGDMTKFKEWNFESNIDVFVGGTPCQSFSVAGLRKGLDDPRGNLMLTYLAIANQYRPKWLVWENVTGVLSSNGGLDFASLLRGMGECGYGFAYRVLDAQYFGVAQRRRRVFVVGCLGDWRSAAAVLFERHSLQRNIEPSREKRQGATKYAGRGIAECSPTIWCELSKQVNNQMIGNAESFFIPEVQPSYGIPGNWIGRKPENGGNATEPMYDIAPCLTQADQHGVAHSITYDMKQHHNPQPSNTIQITTKNCAMVRGDTPLVQPIPIDSMNHIGRGDKHSMGDFIHGAPSYTLTKGHSHAVAQPIFFEPRSPDGVPRIYPMDGAAPTLNTMGGGQREPCVTHAIVHGTQDPCVSDIAFAQGRNNGGENVLVQPMAVRRLTPVECERLQGFPDNYTDIKPKGKPTPDGPRYKALGNSMAVPVMAWIGKRIQEVENIKCKPNK